MYKDLSCSRKRGTFDCFESIQFHRIGDGGDDVVCGSKVRFYLSDPSSYRVVVDESSNTGILNMTNVSKRVNIEVLKPKTKKGTNIVAMYVKNSMALLIVLYSHDNVVDLQQMHELFCELDVHLCVNLMG